MPKALATTLFALLTSHAVGAVVDLPRYPAAMPDGSAVIFSWRGDLWRVAATGGEATRLTTNPGDDLRSIVTPDGSTIIFESSREGSRNIWSMPMPGGEPKQITFGDTPVLLGGISVDGNGKLLVMVDSMREGDLYRAPRPYTVPLEGGPLTRLNDAFGSRPTANSQGAVLFERGGNSWLRRGYRGPDARDVWLFTAGVPAEQAFRRLTSWPGNDGQAQWVAPDSYLYLSDRDGAVNLYRKTLADSPDSAGQQLTQFADDLTGFDVSADGSTAFLTRWNQLFRLDLSKPDAKPEVFAISAAADETDPVEVRKVDKDITEALASPDGKSMAFVAYGDIFVRSLDEKAAAVRVTSPPFHERDIAWSPDGTRLFFVSDASGNEDIMEAVVSRTRSELRKQAKAAAAPAETPTAPSDANAATPPSEVVPTPPAPVDPRLDPSRWTEAIAFDLRPVAATPNSEREPQCSPDGKSLSFRRGGDLVVLDLASGAERVFRKGWDQEIEWRWSPDSKWLCFAQDDRDFNRDLWIAPVDGSAEPVNLTRHPDNDRAPRFSADGKLLAFLSSRVDNEADVYTLTLDPSVDAFSKSELEAYFKDGTEAAKKRKPLPGPNAKKVGKKDSNDKPDAVDKADSSDKKDAPDKEDVVPEPLRYRLDDAYLRAKRISKLPGDETGLDITPAGDRLVFSGNDGGTPAVLSVKWDGTEQKKVAPGGRSTQMNLAGDKVTILQTGRVSMSPPAGGGEPKAIDFTATTQIDRRPWGDHRFREAARTLGDAFYDPTMKGLDWAALTERYNTLASAARTDNEFEWCMTRLFGELNASHLGVNIKRDEDMPTRRPVGRLGIRTKPVPDGFEVLALLPEGPALRSQTPLQLGDVMTKIAGAPIAATDSLELRLRGRVAEELVVTVRRASADGSGTVEVDCLITPISAEEEAPLLYKAAAAQAAELVRVWSNGRLGYIHIQSMSQSSLEDFERDLCAAAQGKDGLLVDVRNNGGGSTADRVLASLMTQPHAYTVPRGADGTDHNGYPQDRLYIQRWTLPANMLCNEKSFSNAEIVSHAFKHLKRGSLVGEQTYGGVISTGATSLVDGTSVRLPVRGWYTPDGRDMENNGATPDIRIPANPVDESANHDAQLKAAVDDLLRRTASPSAVTASVIHDLKH